jgi:hypothetical protein
MTRKLGDMGLSVMGSRHVLTITYPAPDETLLETPEALPTSEPETPQVSFTIGAAHLPNIGGASAVWTAVVWASGRNTSGSARTVTRTRYKNGTPISASTTGSMSNNYYWTSMEYVYYGLVVGDAISVALHASGEGVDWQYKALMIFPTRINLTPSSRVPLYRVSYTLARTSLSSGVNPGGLATGQGNWYVYNGALMSYSSTVAGTFDLPVMSAHDTYIHGAIEFGDISQSQQSISNTSFSPYYRQQAVPTQIVYYPLSVR